MRVRGWVGAFLALSFVATPAALATQGPPGPTPYPGGQWSPPAATYGVGEDKGLSVRVSDGALLVVDVSYPTDPSSGKRLPGPFPVLLQQDLYAGSYTAMTENATGQAAPPGAYFVQRGFIFVHLHDRGTGGSQGIEDAEMGPRIGLDGTEIAHWAADPTNVPGTDGLVGLEGCSALGFIQLPTLAAEGSLESNHQNVYVPGPTADSPGTYELATKSNDPIKTAIPQCLAADLFTEQFTDNGIPSAFVWGLSAAQPVTQAALIGLSTRNPASNVQSSAMFVNMMAGGDDGYYDGYWQERDSVRNAADVATTGASILMWPGWSESGFMAAESMYAPLQNAWAGRPLYAPMEVGQKVTPKYQVLIGNWGHGGGLDPGIELEWYDTWMLGQHTGMDTTTTPIHMWEMVPQDPTATSTGRWINASTLPATDSYSALYLNSGGVLSASAPTSASSDTMTWGGGPAVTYSVTQPLSEDMTLIGPRALQLWITSSNTNAQIYAELDDVAPNGVVTPITHGSMLASRRRIDPTRSWNAPNGLPSQPYLTLDQDRYLAAPVPPATQGAPVALDIPLQPVTWRIQAGHTLELKVAPNPGSACALDQSALSREGSVLQNDPSNPTQYGAPVFSPPVGCLLSEPMVQSLTGGVYQILHDPDHPSVLNLPLMPSKSIPTAASAATPTSSGVPLPQNWDN